MIIKTLFETIIVASTIYAVFHEDTFIEFEDKIVRTVIKKKEFK